jgi:uncharacterized protein (TIGR00725 family)
MKTLAVSGKGKNCPQSIWELAVDVGIALSPLADDLQLVTGGLGGVMDGVAFGFVGTTIGLLPASELRSVKPSRSNTISINTGLQPQLRNWVFASAGDAMLSLPGSHGSWEEVCFALDQDKRVWAIGEHELKFPGVVYLDTIEDVVAIAQLWIASEEEHGRVGHTRPAAW